MTVVKYECSLSPTASSFWGVGAQSTY